MKAAVIRRRGNQKFLNIEDVPNPTPAADEALVKVSYVGICGSDSHGYRQLDNPSRSEGLIMGHELSGVVAQTGGTIPEGTRVAVDPQIVCGVCPPCRAGWISICDNKRVLGSSRHGLLQGGMAEYVAVPEANLYELPETVNDVQAAAIEPLSNALHAVGRAESVTGSNVVVIGGGSIGLFYVQCLKRAGARTVTVVEPNAFRQAAAATAGADRVLDPRNDDVVQSVRQSTAGFGADIVVEAVGISDTYRSAIEIVRKRGQVLCFGAVQEAALFPLMDILHKEVTLIGCTGVNDETNESITALADRSLSVDSVVTHTLPLEQADEAMAILADPDSRSLKVMLAP